MNKHISMSQANAIDCGYKTDTATMHKCHGCGCRFKVRTGEYIYTLPDKRKYATKHLKFCSYNCRSKFIKRMEQEELKKTVAEFNKN